MTLGSSTWRCEKVIAASDVSRTAAKSIADRESQRRRECARLRRRCRGARYEGSTTHCCARRRAKQPLVPTAARLPKRPRRRRIRTDRSNGEIVLQLHAWDAHGHPNLCDADSAPHGFGVLLWFQMRGFDEAVAQARALNADILEESHVNSRANHRECWVRDPDGYIVVLVSEVGDVRAVNPV